MSEKKQTDIVDDFIIKLRRQSALSRGPWIDELEAVLQTLFISDNDRAIEMLDEIRGVIERKHVTMEQRIGMIQRILRAGNIRLS